MSRNDYYEIKKIINHIVGDTQQGAILLKAIRSYFTSKEGIDKAGQVKVITYSNETATNTQSLPVKAVSSKFSEEAQNAMDRYTKKLAIENAKYRKAKGRTLNGKQS